MLSSEKACKSCRCRQELSNEYLLAKFGADKTENGPLKVCQKNILKLAQELILMHGLIPIQCKNKKPGEMNIVFTGLKKGEKFCGLIEELYHGYFGSVPLKYVRNSQL